MQPAGKKIIWSIIFWRESKTVYENSHRALARLDDYIVEQYQSDHRKM